MLRIGILSDTHLSGPTDFFREQAAACFSDVSIILHAGDLTDLSVLKVFKGKEVYAVHGNMCQRSSWTALPQKQTIQAGPHRIGLIHRTGKTYNFEHLLLDEFDDVDCVVYGHTHQPVCHKMGSVLLINPGSFMPTSAYGAPGTYAILEIDEHGLRGRIYEAGRKK